jgi:hypothetical protein
MLIGCPTKAMLRRQAVPQNQCYVDRLFQKDDVVQVGCSRKAMLWHLEQSIGEHEASVSSQQLAASFSVRLKKLNAQKTGKMYAAVGTGCTQH